jgi:UDP-glucose:(heptosyl)LPS alpha-1,3-glucosyltransferase
VVVGSGDTRTWGTCANNLGVSERVIFAGRKRDPRPYLWAADVLVHPSHYEAAPLVFLEAAAAGIAIVTTVATDSSQALARAGSCLIVEPSPRAIAEAIQMLLAVDSQVIAERARKVALSFSWTAAVDALESALSLSTSTDRRPPYADVKW